MKKIGVVVTILLSFVFASQLFAKEIKATVTYPYKSFNSDTKKAAMEKARKTAWKKYTMSFPMAKKTTYKENKKEFMSQMGEFIVEEVIVQQKNDKNNKVYKLALRITIDDMSVNELFVALSAAGNQELGEASDFGSLFIARIKTTAKGYDAKRVKITDKQGVDNVTQNNATDGNKNVDAVSVKSFSKKTTGGSTERKRTKVTWEVDESMNESLTGALNEHLANAGFEPMDYNDLADYGAPYMDEIYQETTDKATLKGRTIKAIKLAAMDAEWPFFGYGTADLDLPKIDPATGLFKVSAKITYKVLMFKNGKSRTVATVRPTQVFGMGEEEDYATTEALNKAAEKAMSTVLAQLQKKGIR